MELEMKLVPLTVKVKLLLPTTFEVGEKLVMVGTGLLLTVNLWTFEVPPPGAGLNTVILNTPTAVRFEAGMTAVSLVEET